MLLSSSVFKSIKTPVLCIVLSLVFYYGFAYHTLRTEVWQLLITYIGIFFTTVVILKQCKGNRRLLWILSVVFRGVFLLAIPNLSQDFYRFIWDGQLLLSGLNPYASTPNGLVATEALLDVPYQSILHRGMGNLNASHYTNYPPLNQLCFMLAHFFPGQQLLSTVMGLRIIIIAADLGIIYFGTKLLEALKLPRHRIWWFALNPFIIIELTGNLHFEGVMLFFLIWSLYLLYRKKWIFAAIVLGCSISVKLMPLMFLPLFFGWFNPKASLISNPFKASRSGLLRLVLFYSLVIGTVILLFLPFLSEDVIANYTKTTGLWFTNFEFNASIYYLARAIGYAITGYNEIAIIGKLLPVITIMVIICFSFFRNNTTSTELITSMFLTFAVYLFLSTTVHPWYLATLVVLSLFTQYKFPLIWSVVIILSYASYLGINTADKSEKLWLIGIEYILVFAVFLWDIFGGRNTIKSH